MLDGVAPPPPIIVEVPPVVFGLGFGFMGTVEVVVEVVTVVGRMDAAGRAARASPSTCDCAGGMAATGAASSGGPTLASVTGLAAGGAGWRGAGATRAGRAWWCG